MQNVYYISITFNYLNWVKAFTDSGDYITTIIEYYNVPEINQWFSHSSINNPPDHID